MKKLALFILITVFTISCETDVTDKVITDAYNGTALVSASGAVTDLAVPVPTWI
jgi:hypothetical protein